MKEIVFLDNTRISLVKECPTKYLLKSKLGWVKDGMKAALDFGGSWHEGKAEIFQRVQQMRNYSEPVSPPIPPPEYWIRIHEQAYEAFLAEWVKRGMPRPEDNPELMEQIFPRVPGIAKEMLWNYIQQEKQWIWEVEILDIERPFVVPLFETDTKRIFLVGRRDLTYRDSTGVWAKEHKTSTLGASEKKMKQTGAIFQYKFLTSFNMSPQVAGYTFSLKLEYGTEARGVMIAGDLVHKKFQDKFLNIPVWKDDPWLEGWFNNTIWWIKQLFEIEKSDYYPHNETSCENQYGTCEYRDICETCSDPRLLSQVPVDYKVDFWEPFDEQAMKDIMTRIEA